MNHSVMTNEIWFDSIWFILLAERREWSNSTVRSLSPLTQFQTPDSQEMLDTTVAVSDFIAAMFPKWVEHILHDYIYIHAILTINHKNK